MRTMPNLPWRGLRGAAIALSLASCGGGAEVLVVPLFQFGFDGSSGATTIEVFFLPDRPSTTAGKFDSVNMNVGTAPQIHYDGTWSGCSLVLSLRAGETAPAPAAASYEGRLQGVDKLVLTPPDLSVRPPLTLTRKPVQPVAKFGC